MKACKVFVDTNVLIYQTFEDLNDEKHRLVKDMLQQFHARQWMVYISSQIIREFVAIATNEKILKTSLQSHDVVMKVTEFQAYFHVLFETEGSIVTLKDLIVRHQVRKQAMHDTNIGGCDKSPCEYTNIAYYIIFYRVLFTQKILQRLIFVSFSAYICSCIVNTTSYILISIFE